MGPCRSSGACRRVELGHELAVGGTGGSEVLIALFELEAQVDDVLFEGEVLLLERVDADGSAEPGFAPGALAEQVGEPVFELLDAAGEAGGSLLGVEQVGLQ